MMKDRFNLINSEIVLDTFTIHQEENSRRKDISQPSQNFDDNTHNDDNNTDFYKHYNEFQVLLGEKGEEYILGIEKEKLRDTPYQNQIKQVSKYESSAGYDILSYEKTGEELYIEVKSTDKNNDTFYITQNEIDKASKLKDNGKRYSIYRVVNVLTEPRYYVIENLSEDYVMHPLVWSVHKKK